MDKARKNTRRGVAARHDAALQGMRAASIATGEAGAAASARLLAGAIAVLAALLFLLPSPAPAASAAANRQGQQPLAQSAQARIEEFVRAQLGSQYRVELRFARSSPQQRLQACARIEPFLAPGTRLWGRTSIGVRCVEGANWSLLVPMQVAVFGPALVASRPITANTPLTAHDVQLQEVELSSDNRPVLTELAQIDGQMSARALRPGEALRDYHVRVIPTVRPGDPVRLRMVGRGFVVSADGAAMASAGNGESVRVRTPSGKIMIGRVNGSTVDIAL